jgi:uncharacterized protein
MQEIARIKKWFEDCPGALVAFSGGVDSSLVAFLARHFMSTERCLAVISASASLKLSDLEAGQAFAKMHDIPLRVITTQEIDNPNYFNNPTNRCYYCKHTLYDALADLAAEFPGWWILNGTNTDDLGDYRPGLEAATSFSVHSPLSECNLDKAAIRTLASHFKLQCWDKPASPCLSSRVPYGERITVEKLKQIEAAEAFIAEAGFPVNRVRHYGDKARVEVPVEATPRLLEMQATVQAALESLGFDHVELDAEGFVSGKLNRAILANEEKQQR